MWIFYVFSILCLLCLCARLLICALCLWSPAGKGLTSLLSPVVSDCEFVTFPCKNGNIRRNICAEKRLNTSLKDLSIALNNHGSHGLFSFLSSLPISVLHNSELEANKLYDRANKLYKAALLSRCYVQYFLSPYIDSKVNHKRNFIKIPFINKGMVFIDLHSIFKDNLVILSIPNYFNNSQTPIICYKYNKPIRSTIFNFNKIVTDKDIDSNTPDS